jgi:hypothetical protein
MIVRRDKIPDVAAAFLSYVAITIAMTWPLAAGLARDVPGDLGDSLLNMWILGWGAESLPRVLTGSMSLADVWNANIFHPEPLALSFSEHLFGQVLQILPVYHLSGNLILCYNLLFFSTFVLSGIGMYLLVKEFTGDRYAAFIAGLLFAFVPYRVAQVAHIQSLSSQWMPLALYGFRRYIITSRTRALAGGAAALLMQNWSCGYYLIFFSPLVVLFVVHQLVAAGRGGDWRAWLMFLAAAVAVSVGTWPFLAMYLEAQRVHGFERPLAEIVGFSADIFGYVTAPEALKLLGATLRAWPRPEGELFLGFVATVLAAVGVYATMREARENAISGGGRSEIVALPRGMSLRRVAVLVFGTIALALAAVAAVAIATGGFVTSIGGVPLRATNVTRLLSQLALVTVVLILLSRQFRSAIAHLIASPTGIASVSLLLALWLSLGPVPHARGQAIEVIGLYGVLLDHLPGFGSLRVPARYAMIAAVYLSLLGGIGAAWVLRRAADGRAARSLAIAFAMVFLVEAAFAPLLVNQTWGEDGIIPPPRVEPASSAPAVYRHLRLSADDVVIAEFPFGDPAWELRYVYYSTVHWKRLVNGYSGGFPQGYKVRVARLQRVNQFPVAALQTLIDAGTTHVIVHEAAMPAAEVAMLHAWLQGGGFAEIGRFESDVLYDLPYAR